MNPIYNDIQILGVSSHTSLHIFSVNNDVIHGKFSDLSPQTVLVWPAGAVDKTVIPAAMRSFYTSTPVFKSRLICQLMINDEMSWYLSNSYVYLLNEPNSTKNTFARWFCNGVRLYFHFKRTCVQWASVHAASPRLLMNVKTLAIKSAWISILIS